MKNLCYKSSYDLNKFTAIKNNSGKKCDKTVNFFKCFTGLGRMNLFKNTGWFIGIFAFVALFTGSSMLFANNQGDQPGLVQFSDLTDSDIDLILAVKAEMRAAKTQSN